MTKVTRVTAVPAGSRDGVDTGFVGTSDGQMHATLTDDDCTYRGSTTAAAVEEGKSAPTFTLPSDTGEAVSLESFRGKPVVLYVYPKDDTRVRIAEVTGEALWLVGRCCTP